MARALAAAGGSSRRKGLTFVAVVLLALLALPAGRANAQVGYGEDRTPVRGMCGATGQPNDYLLRDHFITYLMGKNGNPTMPVQTVAWMTANVTWCSDGKSITWGPQLMGDRNVTTQGAQQHYGVVPVGFQPQTQTTAEGNRVVTLESQFQMDYAHVWEMQGSLFGISLGGELDHRDRGPIRNLPVKITIAPGIDQDGYASVQCRGTGVARDSGQEGATRCYRNTTGVAAGPPNMGVYTG